MFTLKNIFVLCCVLFASSESAFVDTLPKCDYHDTKCLANIVHETLLKIAKPGIPEYGIPPIDPLELKNVKLNLLNVVDLLIVEGTVKGVKNCQVNDLKLNMEKGHFSMAVLCDISAKGKYQVSGSTPALKELVGGSSVTGNGNAKIKVDKVLVKFAFKFDVVKRDDGEIYIECKKEDAKYDFDLQGGSKIQLDKLYVGDVESSQLLANYYNDNAKTLWKMFGKTLVDVAAGLAYDEIHKFFAVVPVKYYLSGDISQFVKN